MSNFIQPQLRTPNIPQEQPPKKVKLRRNDVSLQFLTAVDTGKFYKIVYLINIIPNIRERDPSKPLQASSVDMKSLEKAIEGKIRSQDRKYIEIKDFNTRKVTFVFKHKEWLRDSVSDTSTRTKLTRFAREFRFRKQIPLMILADPVRIPFADFLIRKFKDYMESKNKEAKWFKHLLPQKYRSRFRGKIRNMFDWEYDFTWNKIIATLKPLYILALMYATGAMVKKISNSDLRNSRNQKLFVTKVKQNLDQFDYGKFNKYSRRKGFI